MRTNTLNQLKSHAYAYIYILPLLCTENLPKEKRIEALKASDRFTVAVLLKQ